MIFFLIKKFLHELEAHDLGFFRVFTFTTFQTIFSMVFSFALVLLIGPRFIAWLKKQKIGDLAKFDQAEIDKRYEGKKGTPTMGGVMIIFAIAMTTLLFADLSNFYVAMALVNLLWLGAVGAADDWLKLTADRRSGSRDGLKEWEKLVFQVGLGVVLGYFTFRYGRHNEPSHTLYFPFFKQYMIVLSMPTFVAFATAMMTGMSNAVNLTDGLDGLAGGTLAIASLTLIPLALIAGSSESANFLFLPYIQASDQMAVLAAAMGGACLGFLWFNAQPAAVFMGDTGSLAMGGLLAYIAIVIRQEFTLIIIGGVFMIEALSVFIQRYCFKFTRICTGEGKRVFLMAPIHHHFQKKGMKDEKIVVRFWLIAAMLAALGLATVKLR